MQLSEETGMKILDELRVVRGGRMAGQIAGIVAAGLVAAREVRVPENVIGLPEFKSELWQDGMAGSTADRKRSRVLQRLQRYSIAVGH